MDDQVKFDHALELIYESALDSSRLRDALGAMIAALDVENVGVLALSFAGNLLWTNRQGGAILREGKTFQLAHGALCAVDANEDVALKKAISAVLTNGVPRNVSCSNGSNICYISLLATRERNPIAHQSASAQILALVTKRNGRRVACVQQLMDHFSLTPAEARFVRALAHGESIDEYAKLEGLKRSTVKSHLSSAMTKTQTRSQKEIVQLVLTLPAIRA